MTTLVILDDIKTIHATLPEIDGNGSIVLLTLSPDEQIISQVKSHLAQQCSQVKLMSAAKLLDEVALQVREEYSRLVAEAPDKIKVGGKSLREAFTFEGKLSLWWLNEIFGKRTDAYPTFSRLCQLEVIRTIVGSSQVTDCYFISQDVDFWEVILSYCQYINIPLHSPKPSRPKQWLPSLSPARIFSLSHSTTHNLVASLAWFGMTAIQTFIAHRVTTKYSFPSNASDRPVCAFHTIYPLLWRVGGNTCDEKYGESPHIIKATGKFQPIYICTFSADGFHQSIGPRRFLHLCRWLQTQWKEPADQAIPIYLLDAYLSWGDFLRAFFLTPMIFWQYHRLEKSPAFRSFWLYKGINFSSLLKHELRVAMSRTPRYLLHALRVRRFIEQMAPGSFVYCLFEYGLGRAIAYGVRSAEISVSLIGVQDGPMTKRRLANYNYPGEIQSNLANPDDCILHPPLPDHYLLEGAGAAELLQEAGYPPEQLWVGGAPRVTSLLQVPRQNEVSDHKQMQNEQNRKVILVAFGAGDSVPMLAVILPVLQSRSGYHFILKLHPRGGSAQKIKQLLTGYTFTGTYVVETGDIYRWVPKADVIIATYSSVAMEAAALGYPVICLHLPNRVNMTPLLDINAPTVRFVANAEELMLALDQTVSDSDSNDGEMQTRKIEEYCFYRLDGRSAERWAQKIVEIIETNGQR